MVRKFVHRICNNKTCNFYYSHRNRTGVCQTPDDRQRWQRQWTVRRLMTFLFRNRDMIWEFGVKMVLAYLIHCKNCLKPFSSKTTDIRRLTFYLHKLWSTTYNQSTTDPKETDDEFTRAVLILFPAQDNFAVAFISRCCLGL